MRRISLAGGALAICLAPSLAAAEVDIARFDGCVADSLARDRPAADCVQTAHAVCGDFPLETARAAAVLCYVDAQDAWTRAIRARLEGLGEDAEGRIAKLAEIEVKYDVLGSLLQCDRMEELARVASPEEDAAIGLQKARCTATALGLAYAKLLLQSRNLP